MTKANLRYERTEQAFPLAALISLLTSVVALLVCIDGRDLGEAVDKAPVEQVLFSMGGALLFGALFGACIGCGTIRRTRGILVCGAAGALAALATLAACVAPGPLAPSIVAVFLPVVTVFAIRWRTT